MKKEKINFGDLSLALKVGMVFAYVVGLLYSIFFIIGVAIEMMVY